MHRNQFPLRHSGRIPLLVRIILLCMAVAIGVSGYAFSSNTLRQHTPGSGPYTFKFTLATNHQASAGIYSSNGLLVRNLYGNRLLSAGSYTHYWDGNDDFGNPMGPDNYTVKLLTHNVTAVWDGTIGNTSTYQTATTKLTGLANFADVLAVGNEIYMLRTYNELGEKIDKFNSATPGQFAPSGVGALPFAWLPQCFATDGTHMYVASYPVSQYTANPTCIVSAYNLDEVTGAWTFTNVLPIPGQGIGQNNGGQWINMGTVSPTSIAVQKTGNLLAVAQYSSGLVQIFDKLGGNPIPGAESQLHIPGIMAIRWSPDGSTLWTAAGSTVTGWQWNGTAWTSVQTLSGTSAIKSFAVNPQDGSLAILYGGTDQQLRGYTPSGTWLYSVGSKGGYASGIAVNDTKFMIPPDYFNGEQLGCGVGFQNDGKVWIVDIGNSRMLRFPVHKHLADARKDAQIAMITGYQLAVDKNNASRLFVGYREYQRDFTQPLSRGEGVAWKLVNNYGYGYFGRDAAVSTGDGFTQVVTAKNGHTYGVLLPADTLVYNAHYVELTPSGIRDTGIVAGFKYLESDMSAWLQGPINGTTTGSMYTQPLTGFDGNNNPVWGASTLYCSWPQSLTLPCYLGGFCCFGGMPVDRLPDGSIATFNTQVGPADYTTRYLGLVKAGATDWWAKTAKGSISTPLQHDGTVPVGGLPNPHVIVDIGGRTLGNMVAMFCNGEAFDSAEADQILLYDGSGLPIMDFGSRLTLNFLSAPGSGRAGNFYGNAFVMGSDGLPHVYCTDEATHGAIHEWTLENTASIQVISGSFDANNTANLGLVGHAVIKPAIMKGGVTVTDGFGRGSSSVVGNGWLDPNSSYQLLNGRLKVNVGVYNNSFGATLVRPEIATDSDQTITIPAQFFDPTKMFSAPPAELGGWGVFSRLQPDGSRYFLEMDFTDWTPDQYGQMDIRMGVFLGGKQYTLAYDHCLNTLPINPGHSYKLELITSGIGPTTLHGVITDLATGTQYVVLDQVSDEPALQVSGHEGIQASVANNEFSNYSAVLSSSSAGHGRNIP